MRTSHPALAKWYVGVESRGSETIFIFRARDLAHFGELARNAEALGLPSVRILIDVRHVPEGRKSRLRASQPTPKSTRAGSHPAVSLADDRGAARVEALHARGGDDSFRTGGPS